MWTFVSACVSAGVTLLICIVQQNKTKILLEYKLNELTKKVDKHNNLVERMYKVEKENEVSKEKIKVANHRIDDLEREVLGGIRDV